MVEWLGFFHVSVSGFGLGIWDPICLGAAQGKTSILTARTITTASTTTKLALP